MTDMTQWSPEELTSVRETLRVAIAAQVRVAAELEGEREVIDRELNRRMWGDTTDATVVNASNDA